MKCALMLAAMLVLTGCGRTPPSDARLTQQFRKLKPTLEAIVKAASAESRPFGLVGGVANPPGAISDAKTEELTILLRQAGVHRFGRREDGSFSFEVFSNSVLIDSWHKGFIHSTNQLETTTNSLDGVRGEGTWLKKIEGNWYIYYSMIG